MSGAATRQMPIADALMSGRCLTTLELGQITGLERRRVADACCRLVSRGWIVRRERGCFELSAAGRAAVEAGETVTSGPRGALTQGEPRRRRRQTCRDRMWSTIRILRKFTIADLEMLAGATADNARHFVGRLERAGYLVRMRKEAGTAPTSNGFNRWMLVRDSGPKPPVYRGGRRDIFDPNTNAAYPLNGG